MSVPEIACFWREAVWIASSLNVCCVLRQTSWSNVACSRDRADPVEEGWNLDSEFISWLKKSQQKCDWDV